MKYEDNIINDFQDKQQIAIKKDGFLGFLKMGQILQFREGEVE